MNNYINTQNITDTKVGNLDFNPFIGGGIWVSLAENVSRLEIIALW